ncbi:MAG: S8 family peptidase [Leptothrix sp. (in: b-proteobacteria)]
MASSDEARVIVKFRSGAVSALSAQPGSGSHRVMRAQTLGQRHGLSMRDGATLADRTQVVHATGLSSTALAERLAADPEVEYAVVDQRRHAHAAPNDPLYAGGASTSPVSGQWYLHAPDSTVRSSINVENAWAITHGSSSVVVAVLDSGVRFDHPDLVGKLLPGYDFVSDVNTANDGDGWDDNPSDPGDWITSTESGTKGGPFHGCEIGDSLWHGTQTAGLVGAMTQNGTGMASVGRNVMVLPVRVLGKCGGYDSDIVVAMRWAAGLNVPGVPANPNPARVINLSLGSAGACNGLYSSVITELSNLGVTIVASAGNDSLAVNAPGNCPGIIAVGGLRHTGTKSGFASLGPEVALSAPAGNCVNTSGACLYPILSTSNTGATTPQAGSAGATYTSSGIDASLGTSFSAPLVSGTVALMLSANPTLSVAEVRSRLLANTRSFVSSGASGVVSSCHAPGTTTQDECYCTTSTCGAGMLDSGLAVQAAAANLPVADIFNSALPVTVGNSIALSGASSSAPSGRTLSSYAWTIISGTDQAQITSATNASNATVKVTGSGAFTVQLSVTDSSGASATTTQTFNLKTTAASSGTASSSSASSSTGGGALDWGWLLGLAAAVLTLARRRQV